MSNTEVRNLLGRLRAEIKKGGLDDETRSMVRQLDADIHTLLEADSETEADPIVERAREIEADFASEHPTTAGILREVIAALARMGI